MSNLLYLGVAVGFSCIGLIVLWLFRRRPRSMQAGLDAFSREMSALAPSEPHATRSEGHVDRVVPSAIRPRTADRARSTNPASDSADRELKRQTGRPGGLAPKRTRSGSSETDRG